MNPNLSAPDAAFPRDPVPLPFELRRRRRWTPHHILVFEARNTAPYMVNVVVVFLGAAGERVQVRIGLFPDWPTRIALPLETSTGRTLFLARTPGRFKTVVAGGNLPVDRIAAIRIELPPGADPAEVRVGRIGIAPRMPKRFPLPAEPVVDAWHQWRAKSWSGKADSRAAIRDALRGELAGPAPAYPDDWSSYGGWTRRTFPGTGWFRTEYDGRRWWIVDPAGCAFWSMGVDCINASMGVNAGGLERLFRPRLPSRTARPDLWNENRQWGWGFDALRHNLERALGTNWAGDWLEFTRRRLVRYRFNTVANWSQESIRSGSGLPFVFTMAKFPGTTLRIFRDFPDVFSAEYAANSRDFAAQLEAVRDRAHVIGYFMTNEPAWAFLESFDLGRQLLLDDRPSATREAFIAFLAQKYGTVECLNRAWGAAFASFTDLNVRQDLTALPGSAPDTKAFTTRAIEEYIRRPAEACRAVDPHHMNLGLRWAWIHSDYQLAGSRWLDAFSINCYQLRPDASEIERIAKVTGKPVMIGEFHIGSLDRGLPSGGIRNVRTLAESGRAYRYYMEQAAVIPALVGAHYFQWNDQHVLGRFDGENMQIGLHDITGRPHAEMVEACRAVNEGLYAVRAGERAPFDQVPDAIPQGTLCW